MTKKDIFEIVEDVKKALESDKHYIYVEIFDKVYDVYSLLITGISVEGAIRVYDERAENAFWFNLKQLMTKADAEKRKDKTSKEIYKGI